MWIGNFFKRILFYDWDSKGTREDAAYGGAFLRLLTLFNGIFIMLIRIFRWINLFHNLVLSLHIVRE